MPTIEIIDESSSLTIVSQESTPALAHYLQSGLVFVLDKTSPAVKQAEGKRISDIDPGGFPVSLSPTVPASFAVSSATVNVEAGFEASIDLLTGSKGRTFAKSLGPNAPSVGSWASFSLTAELNSGPSGTVGDFSFGLLSGEEIKLSNYCPVASSNRAEIGRASCRERV